LPQGANLCSQKLKELMEDYRMTAIPFYHDDRPPSVLRPLKALYHFRKLAANTEDTEQAFQIMTAMNGTKARKIADRFWHSETGQRLLAGNIRLIDALDDHQSLKRLPADTVGRAYVDFMECEGLSAQGLEREYVKFTRNIPSFNDGMQRYIDRLRDTHDLMHVLTGYGRDVLGEQCLFALTYSQTGNYGRLVMAYAGAVEMARRVRFSAPIFRAVYEGKKIGKAANYVAHEDIVALLREPLVSARRRMNFAEPLVYRSAVSAMRRGGFDARGLAVTTP
jgi:ubiquinone biosynthesis protein COQ4